MQRLRIIFFQFFICACFFVQTGYAQLTPYELKGKNYTATYQECMLFYENLAKRFKSVSFQTIGMTDAGEPLHLVMISSDGKNIPGRWRNEDKIVVLVMNGIHPGEPDGIDASMMMARDIARQIEHDSFQSNIAIAIIPVYNIGGCLLRSEFNRVDQNGPESFGARGNSQNLDLNRDFIKCDSKEAKSFAEIFHWIQPDIFIDNHVSDGADYQHVMTLATTQHNKLGGEMGKYINEVFEPALFQGMKEKNYPMSPYVNVWGKDPRKGITQFFDGPRYSSGYASLFNVFSFTVETHMLKPYEERVDATYKLMEIIFAYSSKNADKIKSLRREAFNQQLEQKIFPLSWKNDESKFIDIEFKGYTYKTRFSKVSKLEVPYYDRSQPYTEKIKFYNHFEPKVSVEAPEAYIVPQGYWKVIELLKANDVEMQVLNENKKVNVEAYWIKKYQCSETPYEGHHANYGVELEKGKLNIDIREGDYYIPLDQNAKRFIIEVLEPQGGDSYFTWNFFDAILIQKEGYSDYAYEDYAAAYLAEHPEVEKLLKEKCVTDTAFTKSAADQLEFVYRNSPYPEPRHNLYPIYRVIENDNHKELNLKVNDGPSGIKNKEDE